MSHPSLHLLLQIPDDWTTDQRGEFFEAFVEELLRPMRLTVDRRLRFTGMEIDLLAKGLDEPRTILIECKAQREALSSDIISKLLGNVTIRGADAGWLFSTSDLTKDGRGQWEEIQTNPALAPRFRWYPPEKLIEILIEQRSIVPPRALCAPSPPLTAGDATLVCTPLKRYWLTEVLEDGFPAHFMIFEGSTGKVIEKAEAALITKSLDRFSSLHYLSAELTDYRPIAQALRAPVARVVSGDAWDDLRPARPADFVGRDDLILSILEFIDQVRNGETNTRTFALQGDSGWGKSSLVLKLSDIADKRRRLRRCSLSAVDSRSATNSAFVSNALRVAFTDAASRGIITKRRDFEILSLTHPLDSPDVLGALNELKARDSIIVLVFDQFEELFTKESLFETFNAVRELSLDLDSKQVPLVLGFAWKTDISLPQQHPAYHLWHALSDRRRDFRIRRFGPSDIGKVISRSEREMRNKLSPALRARLIEQCQGYPWLLKKLLVHVAQRLREASSQYALLERELDVEMLFQEDVAGLSPDQLRCLKYVAERAPAYVSEVEEHFQSDTTSLLLSKHLLVRSGLNYVIYWDIFRDYLTEGKVPQIPWTRAFQRDPRPAVVAAQAIQAEGEVSARKLAAIFRMTERGCQNILGDLVALQIVDRIANEQYRLASHIKSTAPQDLAEHVNEQLARHVVCRDVATRYDRDTPISIDDLETIVRRTRPDAQVSANVLHQYAMNLKRWLLFAGHLEERGPLLYRPVGRGAQTSLLRRPHNKSLRFLGSGTADGLVRLLVELLPHSGGVAEITLREIGLRNALYDAFALGLVARRDDGRVYLVVAAEGEGMLIEMAKQAVLRHPIGRFVASVLAEDPEVTNAGLGARLRALLNADWKQASALRYANGLRRLHSWAVSEAKFPAQVQ